MSENFKKIIDRANKNLQDMLNGKSYRLKKYTDGYSHYWYKIESIWLDKNGRIKEEPYKKISLFERIINFFK